MQLASACQCQRECAALAAAVMCSVVWLTAPLLLCLLAVAEAGPVSEIRCSALPCQCVMARVLALTGAGRGRR